MSLLKLIAIPSLGFFLGGANLMFGLETSVAHVLFQERLAGSYGIARAFG